MHVIDAKSMINGKPIYAALKFFILTFFFVLKKKVNQSRAATCRWDPQTVQKLP